MPLPVRFRVIQHKTSLEGLRQAESILRKNLRAGLNAVGKRFVTSSKSRMRKDTGEERGSLQIKVYGSSALDLGVLVFSEKVQALIDAVGLPRGIFPPYREGTRLYRWASRKARGLTSTRVKRFKAPKRTLYQLNASFERRRKLRQVPRVKKRRLPRASGNKRVRRLRNDTRRLAFLAARAIYKRGIKATHWNTRALEANKNAVVREISNSIARAVSEMRRK